jgi:hypothetical protein
MSRRLRNVEIPGFVASSAHSTTHRWATARAKTHSSSLRASRPVRCSDSSRQWLAPLPESDMADDLANLDRRIAEAMATLRSARAATQRVAVSTTRWHEEMAERRLNDLLDRRHRCQIAQQAQALAGATAASRPIP